MIPVKAQKCLYTFPNYACMALLGTNGEPAHNVTSCKEYILDYTYKTLHGECNVFMDEVRLVTMGLDDIEKVLKFVNSFELLINVKPTYYQVGTNYVLFVGDKKWFLSPHLLSLYGLLIRFGRRYKEGKDFHESVQLMIEGSAGMHPQIINDLSYMKGIQRTLRYITSIGIEKAFGENMENNWKLSCNYSIHERGIVDFAKTMKWPY